jgi:phosphopantothenoylcysteine decarboxylase/phosphopantothenate--cysteine ligase
MHLLEQNILLGVTGGIAAYKAPDLVRKLVAQGANVRVVLTRSATEFVSPLSLQAVSGNTVSFDLLDPAAEAAMGHIELAKWADKLLIAPASANFMAKLANGLADDLLSTLCLATDAPVYIAPAMNQQMWKATATQANLQTLNSRDVHILGPAAGEQACGDVGVGRMLEPEDITEHLYSTKLPALFYDTHIVITAGPTREAIDPVRYLTNHSSGKMGYAIAAAAQKMGAKVTLVSGPTNLPIPNGVSSINVESAADMHQAVMDKVADCDIFIGCAAVADYRPVQKIEQKIKKTEQELTLTFTKNPDILADVAKLQQAPFTLGFAAETQDVATYAKQKLERKNLNMIAANDVSKQDQGFNSDKNALTIYWNGGEKSLQVADKSKLAEQLLVVVAERYGR